MIFDTCSTLGFDFLIMIFFWILKKLSSQKIYQGKLFFFFANPKTSSVENVSALVVVRRRAESLRRILDGIKDIPHTGS